MAHPSYLAAGIARARRLRRDATFPERLLWSRLRRGASGIRFRRQHPVGRYIVDFYAPRALLVVEVDGRSHDGRCEYDAQREAAIRAEGLMVVRVSNDDVLADVDAVAAGIAAVALQRAAEIPRGVAKERPA